MTKTLDENRRIAAEWIKKFEKRASENHALADKLHKKMEKLHIDTAATRERACATRKRVQAARIQDGKRSGRKRKAS